MAHVRSSIRAALAAALTGLPTTGARVFEVRDTDAAPLVDAELPGLLLGWSSETVLDTLVDGTQYREFQFEARGLVKADSGYAGLLDTIAAECEAALDAAADLGGALSVTYDGIAAGPEVDSGMETTVATALIVWRVQYAIDPGTPGVAD